MLRIPQVVQLSMGGRGKLDELLTLESSCLVTNPRHPRLVQRAEQELEGGMVTLAAHVRMGFGGGQQAMVTTQAAWIGGPTGCGSKRAKVRAPHHPQRIR